MEVLEAVNESTKYVASARKLIHDYLFGHGNQFGCPTTLEEASDLLTKALDALTKT